MTYKLLFFCIIFSSSLNNIKAIQEAPLADVSPTTLEFAWDVHRVLVRESIPGMINVAFKDGGFKVMHFLGLLCCDYTRYKWNGKTGRALHLARALHTKIMDPIGSTAEEYKPIIDAYDPTLWAVSRKMASEYYPISGMEELLNELHELGYTQQHATNMGKPEYKDLNTRHPHTFKHLTSGLTVDPHESDPARKPSIRYFQKYQNLYNPSGKRTIIFIDDRKENIETACDAGMIGVLFKNAHQLRNELKKLGIPLS